MATDNLENAVIASLDRIGRVRTLEIAPELASLQGWTNESLAMVMTDANDNIRDKEYQEGLLFLKEFFCSTEAAQNERKPDFDVVIRSLAETLRFQRDTVGINYRFRDTTNSITAILGTDAAADYLPVVRVVIGKEMGPVRAALQSIFSVRNWDMASPVLADRFAISVLRLWREVLQTWIQMTLERENSLDAEIISITTSAPVAQAKVRRGTVPIEIDIEPARPVRAQGMKRSVKRSRPVTEEDSPSRLRKRKAIPTPPSTPAVEELENGHTRPPVRSRFISALIEAIPSRPTPSLKSGVDITYTFRRQRFSDEFGSSSQGLESSWKRHDQGYKLHRKNCPPRKKDRPPGAGSEHLIGGQIGFNPYFPQTPCARGLVYRAPGYKYKFGNEVEAEPRTHTVLFQVAQAQWLYLGEYVVTYKCSLPRAEWDSSTPEVSSNDLTVITAYGRFFFLRKFKDGWVKHITEKPNRYDGPQVLPQAMRRSLDAGKLKLEVYEMKCVDYHVALQAKIIELGL